MLQYVLGDRRFVDRGVLVRPEVLQSIIGDALPLGLAYHPRQTVHVAFTKAWKNTSARTLILL
jgi:hypothetical protein